MSWWLPFRKRYKFDPAIYYGELPARYIGHVRFVRAISDSEDYHHSFPFTRMSEELLKELINEFSNANRKVLERKLIKKLKKGPGGDLIVLDEPALGLTEQYSQRGKNNDWYVIEGYTKVNGILYKTSGINTSFVED